MIMSGRISPQVPDEDVIIERSGITDRVQIIRSFKSGSRDFETRGYEHG